MAFNKEYAESDIPRNQLMKTLKQRLDENYIVGCIKHRNQFQFYLMPIAWWILDYQTYDPSISQRDEFNFRDGIYNVTDDKIEAYLSSISIDNVSFSETKYIQENFAEEYSRITFFIDFDKKEYVNGFPDIDVEEYLPDEAWKGKFDWDPEKYIPDKLLN
ncbi:MAG: hypothetical protein ABIN67_13255 [Ferruginibacter sp.]